MQSQGVTTCESPTLSKENYKPLAVISLDYIYYRAMELDDFSIHIPISTHDSLPELLYCHLNSSHVVVGPL